MDAGSTRTNDDHGAPRGEGPGRRLGLSVDHVTLKEVSSCRSSHSSPQTVTATLHYLKRGTEKPTRYVAEPDAEYERNGIDDRRGDDRDAPSASGGQASTATAFTW